MSMLNKQLLFVSRLEEKEEEVRKEA